jgi:hypothetical protein
MPGIVREMTESDYSFSGILGPLSSGTS